MRATGSGRDALTHLAGTQPLCICLFITRAARAGISTASSASPPISSLPVTLRQSVVEIRQLLVWLRGQGATKFGLLGSSYGGWLAALLASLEPDLHFLALLAPLVNLGHALYEGPTSWTIRNQLARAGLDRALVDSHAHLSSPLCAPPAGRIAERTLIVAGLFDHIVRLADLAVLHESWPGSELLTVPQAHFGYAMIPQAVTWLCARGLLTSGHS